MLSPFYGDLAGLPPIIIHAADYDVFLSDSIRFADKAKKSGVNVSLKIWENMWHIFPMQEAIVPEAKKAMEEIYMQVKNF
jgi:acetyl esterase/lipase